MRTFFKLTLRFTACFLLVVGAMPLAANPIIRNSVSNLHITSFTQDSTGYVWIATAKGLSRYNSYEYFQYFNDSADPRTIPSDIVTSLYADSRGDVWVATDNGVCRYEPLTDDFTRCEYMGAVKPSFEYGFREYGGRLMVHGMNGLKVVDRDALSVEVVAGTEGLIVQTTAEDNAGNLWVGSRIGSGVLCRIDPLLSQIDRVAIDGSVDVLCSYAAPGGAIWFGTNQGVIVVDPESASVDEGRMGAGLAQGLSKLHITFFHEVSDNDLLVGTQNQGLYVLDLDTGQLVRSSKSEYFPTLPSSHCTTCFTDRDQTIWLGTFDKGFFTEIYMAERFNNDSFLNSFLEGKFVTRIVEAPDDGLWFGTRYNGLIHYDGRTKTVTEYNSRNFAPFTRSNSDFVQSLLLDSHGNLWVGYDKYLLVCHTKGGRISGYRVYETNVDIVTMAEDAQSRVWAGSSLEGISIYDLRAFESPRRVPFEKTWNNVTNIIRLQSGEMMFSVYDDGIYIADPGSLGIRPVMVPPVIEPQAERCISLFESSGGDLWIGTYGRGAAAYNRESGRSRVFTPKDGIAGSDVLTITEDRSGALWMSTSSGLSKYNPSTGLFLNFYDYDGTGGNQFHEKAVMRSASGRLWFGGNHGVSYFDPADIIPDHRPVPVILEDLKIMNISEVPGADRGVLDRHIAYTDAITLNHRQTVFSIDYSGINFASPQKVNYAYRLRNFDRDWNYVGDYRRAAYSNLSPGHYVFEVMAQNPDGTWNDAPTTLDITVRPAPWSSPLAYAGYLLMGALIVFIVLRIQINRRLDRQRIAFIEKEREHEQEMNDLKIRFFTNISHEIRTPLSMIYGPAKELNEKELDLGTRKYLLELLTYNADNLLRLIDQLMDFAKLESDTLSLAVAQTDPVKIAREVVRSYSYYAKEKDMEVGLDAPESIEVWADSDKIRKILSNLLSNALKYTPAGGHIHIRMKLTDTPPAGHETKTASSQWLVAEVEDDGIGMSREDMGHLFKRHKRVGPTADIPGKGIGLHYVKSLVEIHKGWIAPRQAEGHGMVFTFALPAGRDSYSEGEMQRGEPGHIWESETDVPPLTAAPVNDVDATDEDPAVGKPTVLVVEDNADLSAFITHLLGGEYRMLTAADGVEGLEKAHAEDVDLIVSDVLMPRMNGYELCGAVKGDPELSHIPFVILTAKTMDIDQIEGYSHGADAYVNKPFNPELLQAIIRNQFAGIQRRAEYLQKHAALDKTAVDDNSEEPSGAPQLGALDRRFLEKLYGLFDERLSDSDLNMNVMAREMAVSRTGFYRKVKALTGQSPNDFLRSYRLNKAAELLSAGEYSINEIVDKTGFGTHSYFSSCFKKKFGVNPKDYRKSGSPDAS